MWPKPDHAIVLNKQLSAAWKVWSREVTLTTYKLNISNDMTLSQLEDESLSLAKLHSKEPSKIYSACLIMSKTAEITTLTNRH